MRQAAAGICLLKCFCLCFCCTFRAKPEPKIPCEQWQKGVAAHYTLMGAACTSKGYITTKFKQKQEKNSMNYVLFNVTALTKLLIGLLHIDTATHGASGIALAIDSSS